MTKVEAIAELLRLTDWKPRDRGELSAWVDATIVLSKQLGHVLPDVPHVVWHWLIDADIRFKDSVCAQTQEPPLLAALEALEREHRR